MPGFLASATVLLWFLMMFWIYLNTPTWFFIPFFVATTMLVLKITEAKNS
ncbi:MAG: hypothetical protein VKJ24_03390 [Synechococcales bacterium]|nr:hypothetical protein [Synechococcales bacterium]